MKIETAETAANLTDHDWCTPYIDKAGNTIGTYVTSEGLDMVADPAIHVRPIPRILCNFPGVVTDQLIYWMEDRGADVSQYSGPGYFTQPNQLHAIIRLTEANLSQKRYLTGPIDPNYRFWLMQNKIPHALLYPDKSMRAAWRKLLIKQGNTAGDAKVFFNNWDRTIDELDKAADNGLVQRYPVTIEDGFLYLNEVPEYLKPDTARCKRHLVPYHDHYEFKDGVIADGKEPIYQIEGEIYGRVKEHRIQLARILT